MRLPQVEQSCAFEKRHADLLPPDVETPGGCSLLFKEQLGLVFASAPTNQALGNRQVAAALPRLETRTRSHVWTEWTRLVGKSRGNWNSATKVFDHYHLTIEANLSGLALRSFQGIWWPTRSKDIDSSRPRGFSSASIDISCARIAQEEARSTHLLIG